MLVETQLFVAGLYLPPVLSGSPKPPPQTIISLPVHTAVWPLRASGAFVVLVGVQLLAIGLYLPPVFSSPRGTFSAPDNHFSSQSRLPCAISAGRVRL